MKTAKYFFKLNNYSYVILKKKNRGKSDKFRRDLDLLAFSRTGWSSGPAAMATACWAIIFRALPQKISQERHNTGPAREWNLISRCFCLWFRRFFFSCLSVSGFMFVFLIICFGGMVPEEFFFVERCWQKNCLEWWKFVKQLGRCFVFIFQYGKSAVAH